MPGGPSSSSHFHAATSASAASADKVHEAGFGGDEPTCTVA